MSNISSITITPKLDNIIKQQRLYYNQRLHITLVHQSTNNNKEIKAGNNIFFPFIILFHFIFGLVSHCIVHVGLLTP